MFELPVSQRSAWDESVIEQFLKDTVIPLRISVNDKDGFPLICSLWYYYHNKNIYCATSSGSRVCDLLMQDGRCAFEVAPDSPPYRGVRGQANVTINYSIGKEVLKQLITRYLGNTHSSLAKWLLSRVESEVSLILKPVWISSWDYTDRMNG